MLMEAAYYIFGTGREDGRGLLGEAVRSCGSRHWSLMRQGLGTKLFKDMAVYVLFATCIEMIRVNTDELTHH